MKLFYCGLLALTLTAVFAAPALAHRVVLDVCVDAANFLLDDTNMSGTPDAGEGFVATGNIYREGTIPNGGVALCSSITNPVIGTFFARGRLLADLLGEAVIKVLDGGGFQIRLLAPAR